MTATRTIESTASALLRAGVRRVCFYREARDWKATGRDVAHWRTAIWFDQASPPSPEATHPSIVSDILEWVASATELHGHEMIWLAPYIGADEALTVFVVAVHSTTRGAAQGGTRFAHYSSFDAAIADALRLSEGMTRKSALAGLWWGGGKSIIPRTSAMDRYEVGSEERSAMLRAFGQFVASLGGLYYAAADLGTKTEDMDTILSACRFVTCISREKGGSGDPSPYTARAVLLGIETSVAFLRLADGLSGLRFSVQGAGHVGARLTELLSKAGALCFVADYWDHADLRATQDQLTSLPGVKLVHPPEAIYDQQADVFCPCAAGGSVDGTTIPRLSRAGIRLVVGAANNVLANPLLDSLMLSERQIAYLPDFVVNSGGIANCADEPSGYLMETVDGVIARVPDLAVRVFNASRRYGITTLAAADIMADEASRIRSPLYPGRCQQILRAIIEGSRDFPERSSVVSPKF